TLEDKAVRNRLGEQSKKALTKQKPSPITSKKSLDLIQVGNMTDDMEKLSEVDWIIEVVVENLDIKKKVFANVDQYRKEGTVVTFNTSGLSVEGMIEDCLDRNRTRLHFSNVSILYIILSY